MANLLFIFLLSLLLNPSQNNNEIESALLQHNGPKALYEIGKQDNENYNYLSLAWHFIGNDNKQLFYANQWLASAGNDNQRARANLAFAQRNWDTAAELYERIPEKNTLDFYRHAVSVNNSNSSPETKGVKIDRLISENDLGGIPLFQLERAEAYSNQRNFEEAIGILDRLRESSLSYINIQAYQKTSRLHLLSGDMNSAYSTAEKALQLNTNIKNHKGEAYCLYLMSLIKARQGAYNDGKELAVKGAFIARKTGNRFLEFNLNNIKSWTFFMTGEDFNVILEHEGRQFELVNDLGNDNYKADVYNNLSYDLTVAGRVDLDSLISLMNFANDTYAKNEGHQGRWYTLMNLTWQHRLKGEFKESEKYAQKSLYQALKIEDRHAVIEASFQFGETLLAQNKTEEAPEYYELGLKWREDKEDRDRYVFDVYYSNYLWVSGERDRAVQILEKAVEFLKTSEVFYEMHGRALLSKFYYELNEYDQAREQIQIIDNPRNNYIAFESIVIANITKARLLSVKDKSKAENLLLALYAKSDLIGAGHLKKLIDDLLIE